ncbi:MAG: amino acid permease [Acidobacteria bacterium]|nr:amino acid permease [Acidobacteriota bacterium]
MMVVGAIIGAGIFLNPAIVAERVGTAELTLAAWITGGIVAIAGGFCFAELGARAPHAGGGYAYLRDAFGPLPAFLYGWTLLLVIGSGAVAAVAEIGARYSIDLLGASTSLVGPLAIGYILLFTAINYLGVRPGAMVQNVFTVAKLAALGVVIVAGIAWGSAPTGAGSASVPAPGLLESIRLVGLALIPVMFATGGWQNANFVGAEIRDAQRTLPRAILLGVAIVVVVYVSVNVAYLRALGVDGLAASVAPAADTMRAAVGETGAQLINVGIVASTLGILNLFILASPRVYQAMADDGLFFKSASRLHPRYRTPSGALIFQAGWAITLSLSGTYGDLLDYVVFGDWIFFGLVALTIFVYRARDGAEPTPGFRMPAFRLITSVFVLAAAVIVVSSIASNPGNAAIGAALIALGVPVFFYWQKQ